MAPEGQRSNAVERAAEPQLSLYRLERGPSIYVLAICRAQAVRTVHHFHFFVAFRRLDGTFDTPVREESIVARTADEAIETAKSIHVDMIGTGSNAVYLTASSGQVIWSLRLSDVWLEPPDGE